MNPPETLISAGFRALKLLDDAGWDCIPFEGGAPGFDDPDHGNGGVGVFERDRRAFGVVAFADGTLWLDGLEMPGPKGETWAAAFEGRAELDVSGGPTDAELRRFFEGLGLLP